MSSTGQPTSSATNFKLFTEALANYTRITGIDLSTNPFVDKLEQSNSPEDILRLLLREEAFKKIRIRNRKLIDCITPCVGALHAISGTLGEALSLPAVSYTRYPVNRLT